MNKENGFSLVEILLVVFLSSLVLGGIYKCLISQSRAYMIQEGIVEANYRIRNAMGIMCKEIRLAGYKTATATFNGISEANERRIRVLSDLDQDGSTSGPNEDIIYSYDPDSMKLYRGGRILAEKMTSLFFIYTMEDGSETNSPADVQKIRKIRINVVAQTDLDPNSMNYHYLSLSSEVTPRNLSL
jgi:type IV pilus assembly protein PilW